MLWIVSCKVKLSNASNAKAIEISPTSVLDEQNVVSVRKTMRPKTAAMKFCNVLNVEAHMLCGIMSAKYSEENIKGENIKEWDISDFCTLSLSHFRILQK